MHAKIVSEPEDQPWKLREFMAADLDGNLIRVFYDFRGDMQKNDASCKVAWRLSIFPALRADRRLRR